MQQRAKTKVHFLTMNRSIRHLPWLSAGGQRLCDTHRLRGHGITIIVTAIALATLVGCNGGMDAIDRQADAIIAEHTALLSQQTHDAAITAGQETDGRDREHKTMRYAAGRSPRRVFESSPRTVNPDISEIRLEVSSAESDLGDQQRWDRLATAFEQSVHIDESGMMKLSLEQVLALAVGNAPEYLTAKEELLLASLSLLSQRHRFGPRFFNEVSSTFSGDLEYGDFDAAVRMSDQFRITRQLETGGQIGLTALVQATEQLRSSISADGAQSAQIVLSANIPLLRGAGDVARESLLSAERQMVYATRTFERFRRRFLFDIATNYYDLVRSAAQIKRAEEVLESRRELQRETDLLYRAGRRPQFETSEAEQRVLSSENSLASQRDRYRLQLEQFRVRLGLPPDTPIVIDTTDVFDLPVPTLDPLEGARQGLMYRLDLQTTRDRLDDTRRALELAENDLLPDLGVSLSATLPTDPDKQRSGLDFDFDQTDFTGSITLDMPLDRKIERIGVRQAQISYERALRNLRQEEDNVALSIRSVVRDIQLAELSVELQAKSIEIIRRRIKGMEIRKEKGSISTRQVIDAQDELNTALQQLEDARRNLRVAILRYLLETGQFRVEASGRFMLPIGLKPITLETPETSQDEQPLQTPQSTTSGAEGGTSDMAGA